MLDRQGQLWAYRQGSPLIIGRDEHGAYYFSSDLASLSEDATEYALLAQEELLQLDSSGVRQQQGQLTWQKMDAQALSIDRGEFAHFMLKEIMEQPAALRHSGQAAAELLPTIATTLQQAQQVFVVGAGSASFAALSIAQQLRPLLKQVTHLPAYDYAEYECCFQPTAAAIVLSQSGETADTIEAVEAMQRSGMKIISVINMPNSSLSQLADHNYPLNVGAEVGVASTKAMTAQMLFGMRLAAQLQGQLAAFETELTNYTQELAAWLADHKTQAKIAAIAEMLVEEKENDVYVLGRGGLLPAALESALKIKEVSYLHAEGFSAGELKHGVIALISQGTPVLCLAAADRHQADMASAAHQVKARGAFIIGLASTPQAIFDQFMQLPQNQTFIGLSSIIAAQLLSYQLAVQKGLDPDKPRNLAKSVTVK
jgi:glucosamine--fructose-6-phosphate aminotransferase (isomerizing)